MRRHKIILDLVIGLFLGLLIAGCLSGCCRKEYPTTVKDSTIVRYEPKDTVIRIKGDSVEAVLPIKKQKDQELKTPVDEDIGQLIVHNSDRAHLEVRLVHDTIRAKCKCDSAAIAAKLMNKITEKQHIETQIVREKYVPKVVNILAWVGGLAVLGAALILILKAKKIIKI